MREAIENRQNLDGLTLVPLFLCDIQWENRWGHPIKRATQAQLLCRILLKWVLPTVGSSPESRVGITHFQLLCQSIVGLMPTQVGITNH